MKIITSIFLFLIVSFYSNTEAQTYLMPVSGSDTIIACSGTLRDNGNTSNYSDNISSVMYIQPGIPGNFVKLVFTGVDLETCCDKITVFSGMSTSPSNIIGVFTGTTSFNVVSSDISGSITIVFESDEMTNDLGFSAAISCVPCFRTDLTVTNLSTVTPTVPDGRIFTMTGKVNNANWTADASKLDFYLSIDSTYDFTDDIVGGVMLSTIAAGSFYSFNTNVTIATGTAPGNYYIIAKADDNLDLDECDETNNTDHFPITIVPAFVDMKVNSITLNANSNYSGYFNNDVAITGTVVLANIGNAPYSGNGTYKIWFSEDSLLNSNDIYINGGNITLNYSSTTNINFTHTPSLNFPPGNYYLIVDTDTENRFSEPNELNNVTHVPLLIQASYHDLEAISISGIPSSFNFASYSLNLGIKNSGRYNTNSSFPCEYMLFLSADTLMDNNDIVLNSNSIISGLPINTTTNFSRTINFTGMSYPAGPAYILLYVDSELRHAEANENNNLIYAPIIFPEKYYDDSTNVLNIASNLAIGVSFTLSSSVKNKGTFARVGAEVGYYISTDNILDASDYLLGSTTTNNSANPYADYSFNSVSVSIPPTFLPGNYFILAVADPFDNVEETNENNNVLSEAVVVDNFLPDVKINSFSVPNSIYNNGLNTLTLNIGNSGTATATNFYVSVYFSTDTIYDINDITVYDQIQSNLNVGTNATLTITDYPTSLIYPLGPGYFLAFVNKNNAINEISLLNNAKYDNITVYTGNIDIIASNPYASNGTIGTSSQFYFKITNNGPATATTINYSYYISTDNILDGSDLLIYSNSTGMMHDNAFLNTNSYNYVIPFGTIPGNYYAIFTADPSNLILETNETNNIVSDAFTISAPNIGPDLDITTGTTSHATIGDGTFFGGTINLSNIGTTNSASSSNCGIYLSTDAIFDATDILLTTKNNGAITAGGTSSPTYIAQMPYGIPPGSYSIIFFADYDSLVAESFENNNYYAKSITVITASNNLKMLPYNFPNDTIYTGTAYTYYCYVKNIGNNSHYNGSIKYYLSTDTVPDVSDVLVNSTTLNTLSSGNSVSKNVSVTIANGTPDGDYYFIYFVDPDLIVQETNEYNNYKAIPIHVKKPYADLELKNYLQTNSQVITSGTTLNYSFYSDIRNIGESAATTSTVRFYLSADTLIDGGDIILGTTTGGSLNPSASYTSRNLTNINIATMTAGNYFVIQMVDPTNSVVELDETNNIRHYPLYIHPHFVNYRPYSSTIDYDTIPVGGTLTIATGQYNHGSVSGTATHTFRIYLSTDTIPDITDVLFYNNNYNGTSQQNGFAINQTTLIPVVPAGDYFVLCVTDMFDNEFESDETDNVKKLPLHIVDRVYEFYSRYLSVTTDTLNTATSYVMNSYLYNDGNTVADNVATRYFFSQDTIYDGGDLQISSGSEDINLGYPKDCGVNFTIPAGTTGGNYYILFIADFTLAISETNENNNLSYIPVYLEPETNDLTIHPDLINPISEIYTGTGTTTFYFDYINYGNYGTVNFKVRVYLSEDSLLSTSPNYILGISNNITAGANSINNNVVSITSMPGGALAGDYYLIYEIDYQDVINESDENNNTSVVPVKLIDREIDLYPFQFTNPVTATIGTNITLNYSFRNNSTLTPSVIENIHLSTDTILDAGDILLDQNTINSIVGENTNSSLVTIPNSLVTGFYYMIYSIDDSQSIIETNETNNVKYNPIYIQHNLLYTMYTNNTQIINTCSGTIYDVGGANSPYFNATSSIIKITPGTAGSKTKLDFVYFVLDTCCDYLKVFNGPDTLSPLMGIYTTNPVSLISSHSSGSLTLLLKSDSSNVASGLAANISCVVSGNDLVLSNILLNPNVINNNTNTNVSFDVTNSGTAITPISDAKIYISTDNILDGSDLLLSTITIPTLSPLATVNLNDNIIPNMLIAGNYYIFVHIDAGLIISEMNENNNINSEILTILDPNATIEVNFGTCNLSTTSLIVGVPFNVSSDILNEFAAIGTHSFKTFLSTDTIPSSNDFMIDSVRINGINATTTHNENRNITLPANVSNGNQYLLLFEDADFEFAEMNETNNVKYFSVNVTGSTNEIKENNSNDLVYSLYPNPANGQIQIVSKGKIENCLQSVFVFDVAGKLIYQMDEINFCESESTSMDVKQFPSGIYYVKIGDSNNDMLKLFIIR